MSEANTAHADRQGLPRLLWGMIARPGATLAHIGECRRRTWWLPALLILLLLVMPTVASGPIKTRQRREEMRASREEMAERMGQELSEEELEQIESLAASPLIIVVFPAVRRVVGQAAGWLIWAAVLYLASMVMGGRSSFGQMFPVTVWSGFPYALRGLLQTIYVLVSGQVIENPGLSGLVQQASSTAGMVVSAPDTGERVLVSLLSRIDLFLVWHLILLVIGVAAITRFSRRKSVLVIVGVWLLLTALSLVPVFIGGLFAASRGV